MFALARALLSADAVPHDAVAKAILEAAHEGTSLVRALLTTGAVDARRLERHLSRGEVPFMQNVVPVATLARSLPAGLCERLLAVPVRRDPMTGTVDVAVVDARDAHAVEEIAYWLSAPVRMVQTSLASLDAALERVGPPSERGVRALAAPIWVTPAAETAAPETSRYGALPLPPSDERVSIIELGRRGLGEPGPMSSVASTARGPFVPARRAPSSPPSLFPTRDAILDELVTATLDAASRVVVFAVRREGIVGWTSSPGACDRERLRSLRWPPHVKTALQAALGRTDVTTVRIPGDAIHGPLLAVLSLRPGHEVALAPVHADGRPVAVVLADGLRDPSAAQRLRDLAHGAGVSFEALLRRRPPG